MSKKTSPAVVSALLLISLMVGGCDPAQPPRSSLEVAAKGLHAAAIDDRAQQFIAGSIYHGGSLWHLSDQERIFNWNHQSDEATTIIAADFSPDGNWAITADPATLVLWNTRSGAGERYWTAPGKILDAKLGPGGNLAILGLDDHNAVIFDVQRGGIKQTFAHNNRVRSVDFSGDGRLALTGSEDTMARLWDTNTGRLLFSYRHQDDVQLVKLSSDGALALSVSKYDKALVWTTNNGEVLGELPLTAQHLKRGLTFTAARFSDDNQYLLTGRPDQIVQLWQLPQLTEVARWQLPKRERWKPTGAAVLAVAYGQQPGDYIAVASNGFVHWLENKTPGQ